MQHTLTREPAGSSWTSRRGRIDAAFLREHLPPPSADVLTSSLSAAHPGHVYDALSGARTEPALTGLLAGMGYSASQVVKFSSGTALE